jgi:hypothetical protein
MMGNVSGKSKNKKEGGRPEGHNRDFGNTRVEDTKREEWRSLLRETRGPEGAADG